ncbi:MAG: assimilatory sulfite reductase (NADPH) flavoprotein subunit [Coraliomargaritaceae bacterium]
MSHSDSIPDNAPLTPEQRGHLKQLSEGLQPDQLLWLEGFISGLRIGGGVAPASVAVPAKAPLLTVLYGSESGNSESLADQAAKVAKQRGFKPKVVNMSDTTPAKLKDTDNLLVLVSTWGEGDPPETATDFYSALMDEKSPRFEGTNFSVLGLGDTSYEHFCKMGKDMDARLEALGGSRAYARKDCDVDFDSDFEEWLDGSLAALLKLQPAVASLDAASAPVAAQAAVKYSRKNPFPSALKERVLLNGEGSAKETIHLEFDLAGSGLTYEAGDALAVVPHNAPDVVDALLAVANLKGTEEVSLKEGTFSLRDALTTELDITALSKPVINRYNEFAQNKALDELLNDKEKLSEYTNGRDVADLLKEYPAPEIGAQGLAGILRKLPPRLYSIASSPKAHEDEVHLTVGVVRYESHGRSRKGVCSSYLADLIEEGGKADVFVTANKHFKPPANPDVPMIMVGPGTGIAPFRAFVEERAAIEAKGKNWLIFGDQHYLTDFLYQTEWQGYLKDGLLTRLDLAFSRDQAEKVYVQDRMKENAADLYKWLEDGAYFYVCGDASRMAHDVDRALHEIVAEQGGLDEDAASAYIKKLKSDKRYLRDVY